VPLAALTRPAPRPLVALPAPRDHLARDSAATPPARSAHKLAPAVSPNKSWEGAIAGLATSLAATAIWSQLRLGHVDAVLLAIGGATAVASQLGDLVESLLKRGFGVKDSGALLPGHGGFWDRMDAMLFAAPTLLLLLRLAEHPVFWRVAALSDFLRLAALAVSP
jgi:hypothetical protein